MPRLRTLIMMRPILHTRRIACRWNGRRPEGVCSLPWSLNHFIRASEQRLRNGQPEHLRRLEIDDELVLRGLLDGQIRGLGPFQYLVHVSGGAAEVVGD